MYGTHEISPSRRDQRGSSRASTAMLPAINKKALLNDTFTVPLKRNTALTPLTNAPKSPKINNFLASSSDQVPLSLTFGSLELAITGGGVNEDVESMGISHFVKTPEHKRCVQMLTEGFVESFVDFFYLTHKKNENAETEHSNEEDKLNDEGGTISLHDMPNDVLDFLMEKLCEAEDAEREGDTSGVVAAYKSLATHFESSADYATAIHFHQKGLESAFRFGNATYAADFYRRMGVDYEKLGNVPLAIRFFDKFSELVQMQEPGNKEAIAASFRHLVEAYRNFAEQLEEKASLDGSQDTLLSAVEYYQKCLVMAKNCSDTSAEGTVNYRLGLVFKQLNKLDLSIKHLQNYLYLCRINNNYEGESAACSALADSFMASNDIAQSVKYLEENILLAQRTNQAVSQAHACRDLGVIYEQQEDYEKALEYFEKYYTLALASKNRQLVDNSRVFLGIARGNMKLMNLFTIPSRPVTPATMKQMPSFDRSSSSSLSRPSSYSRSHSYSRPSSSSRISDVAKERPESGRERTPKKKEREEVRPQSPSSPHPSRPSSARPRTGRSNEQIKEDIQTTITTRHVDVPPIHMHSMTHSHNGNDDEEREEGEDDHVGTATSTPHLLDSDRTDYNNAISQRDQVGHEQQPEQEQEIEIEGENDNPVSHRSIHEDGNNTPKRPRTPQTQQQQQPHSPLNSPHSSHSSILNNPSHSSHSPHPPSSPSHRDSTPRRPRTSSHSKSSSRPSSSSNSNSINNENNDIDVNYNGMESKKRNDEDEERKKSKERTSNIDGSPRPRTPKSSRSRHTEEERERERSVRTPPQKEEEERERVSARSRGSRPSSARVQENNGDDIQVRKEDGGDEHTIGENNIDDIANKEGAIGERICPEEG